jgi:hypothetical protein
MEIPKELSDSIWDYCRTNDITNIDEFKLRLLKQGFTVEKFGATPVQKTVEVEKIIEKIVEVPVEKIIEKIIEVPVTMVDDELTNNLKKYIKLYEEAKSELENNLTIIDNLKKEIEVLKNKNKKDLYGE